MQIESIETSVLEVPLIKPFKTALRTVHTAQTVVVKMITDEGLVGWGEAPPTVVITGESIASIQATIEQILAPQIMQMDIRQRQTILSTIQASVKGNTSAKAAVDMAVHDLIGQIANLPLYQLLGGYTNNLQTDITVSVNASKEMAEDAKRYVDDGFSILKIKVGIGEIEDDIQRILAIREAIGPNPKIRLDANQGWTPKDAVYAIRKMERLQLGIQFVEQPVKAHQIEGLKYVKEHTTIPIMADESVFTLQDARRVLEAGAADLLNIKLMKCGGICEAIKINALAEAYDVPCMVGSMIETSIGITAAAHFAASAPNIHYVDFDAPLLLRENKINGGIDYDKDQIYLPSQSGLGIYSVQ